MLDLIDQIPLNKAKAQIKNVPEEIKLVLARDLHHLNKLPQQQQKEALALIVNEYMEHWANEQNTTT